MKKLMVWFVMVLTGVYPAYSQSERSDIPKLVSNEGRHTLLVNGAPYFILGAQAHNSSAWPYMLPGIWSALEQMHANTLELPIYWEQVEAQPGKFDFSLVDTLLLQAAAHKMHLVLLWFATWKNGSNHYIPEWMKREPQKYPNAINKSGKPIDSPSPNFEAGLEMDKKAFAAVMHHLKTADKGHIVIMIQVENESGSWGTVRDYSSTAQKLFEAPVPSDLLKPEILRELHIPEPTAGNWEKVFGDRADEYFQAWSVARFVGQVAAAKWQSGIMALPMYANAALREPFTNPHANSYESGGPTDNVISIWKLAAPALDLLAPDIYLSGTDTILKVISLYDLRDNALFIPELGWSANRTKYLYEVMARGGIGFSPFGLDDNGRHLTEAEISEHLAPFALEYAAMAPMMRELAKWGYEGKIKSAIERENHSDQTIDLGEWQAIVSFGIGDRNVSDKINIPPNGKVLVVTLDENRFLVMGTRCRITFKPMGKNSTRAWQYLKVEDGQYENGVFKSQRILNGDETDWGGPKFGATPDVLRISLIMR